jgi:VWFA-related protein
MKYAFAIATICVGAVAALEGSSTSAILTVKKLNIVALNDKGEPVTDLRVSDFQVLEDGKAENIAFFRFTGGRAIVAALEPGQVSNRTGVASHATVILVDLLSDRFLSGGIMGREIGNTLKQLEASGDVYLYFLTAKGELFPVHGLPEPGSEETPAAEPWTRNAGPIVDLAVKKLVGLKPPDDHDLEIRFKETTAAVELLGSQMAQLPGRKNLVWVTHGVPLTGYTMSGAFMDYTDAVRRLGEAFERAQIAIYAVQQSIRGAGEELDTYSGQTLDLFSSLTGGRLYRTDTASIAIEQARTDSRANYRIAYDSEAPTANGKRHKIRVICTRKNVKLQTEQEFYALGLPTPDEFERAALEAAAGSAVDATEIGLRGSVSPEPGAAHRMRLDLRIAREDVLLRAVGDRYVGKVSVNFSTPDAEDGPAAFRPIPLSVNLTAQQYEAAASDGIAVHQEISSDAREVRAIVVDRQLRAVGTITIPVRR